MYERNEPRQETLKEGIVIVVIAAAVKEKSGEEREDQMAFRASQALRMVVKKTSTGLVGLAVDVHARANFIAVQKQILDKIKVNGLLDYILNY